MNERRVLSPKPIARILAGTGAVLAISFTIFSMAATSSAQPDLVAAAVQPSTTASVSQQGSTESTETPVAVAAAPAPTTEPATVAPTTAAAAEVVGPESVKPEPVQPEASAPSPVAAPAAPDAQSLITGRTMHTTASVNLRDAAGVDGTTVIDTLPGNQQLSTGDAVDGWVPVQWGEGYGWVSASYLADGPAADPVTPAPAASAEPAAPAADTAQAEASPATVDAPAAEPAPAPASGNWMTDLIPQVDPNGYANWIFERNGGLGASDGHNIYIDPDVPADERFSVMVHEYSHVLQARVFGSLRTSKAVLSAIIGEGPSDITANESTADCMALMQGATWVDYGCQDQLRPAAAAILAGDRP